MCFEFRLSSMVMGLAVGAVGGIERLPGGGAEGEQKFAQQSRAEGTLSSLLLRHFPGSLGLWRVVSLGRSLLGNRE